MGCPQVLGTPAARRRGPAKEDAPPERQTLTAAPPSGPPQKTGLGGGSGGPRLGREAAPVARPPVPPLSAHRALRTGSLLLRGPLGSPSSALTAAPALEPATEWAAPWGAARGGHGDIRRGRKRPRLRSPPAAGSARLVSRVGAPRPALVPAAERPVGGPRGRTHPSGGATCSARGGLRGPRHRVAGPH